MNRYAFSLTGILMLFASVAHSGLKVRILDAPTVTLVYSPIYVTAELENNGPDPVVIAVRGTTGGCGVEISHSNSPLPSHLQSEVTNLGDDVRLLKPGDKYLFQKEFWDASQEGVYEVRAGVSGSGRCQVLTPPSFPVVPLPVEEGTVDVPMIECWRGNIRSDPIKISVSEPVNALDREALAYVLGTRFGKLGKVTTSFSESFEYLKSHYPSSYYTYVAAFFMTWGDPVAIFHEMMELQPNHPLTEYARLKQALRIMHDCIHKQRGDCESLPKIDPSKVQVSPALQEYIAQFKHDNDKAVSTEENNEQPKSKEH